MATSANPTPEQLQVLLNGPALPPPPGVIPQLDHPPNLQGTGIAVQIVCLVLSTIALCMRLYTKTRIIRQLVPADCQSHNPRYQDVLTWTVRCYSIRMGQYSSPGCYLTVLIRSGGLRGLLCT